MTNYFEKELLLIKNPIIKDIAMRGIAMLPDYFYKEGASSTGKYHPVYAQGEEGLYRHVTAAVALASDLIRISHWLTDDEKDIVITSLILHDGWKYGVDGNKGKTTHSHPIIAADVLRENIHVDTEEGKEFLNTICDNISSHMGEWTTNKYDSTVLPEPKGKMQNLVFWCDYLASRKRIEINFDVPLEIY